MEEKGLVAASCSCCGEPFWRPPSSGLLLPVLASLIVLPGIPAMPYSGGRASHLLIRRLEIQSLAAPVSGLHAQVYLGMFIEV